MITAALARLVGLSRDDERPETTSREAELQREIDVAAAAVQRAQSAADDAQAEADRAAKAYAAHRETALFVESQVASDRAADARNALACASAEHSAALQRLETHRFAVLADELSTDNLVAGFSEEAAEFRRIVDSVIELKEAIEARAQEIDAKWAKSGGKLSRPATAQIFRGALAKAMAGDVMNNRAASAADWLQYVRLRG